MNNDEIISRRNLMSDLEDDGFPDGYTECEACHGMGYFEIPKDMDGVSRDYDCNKCKGTGAVQLTKLVGCGVCGSPECNDECGSDYSETYDY